MKITSAAFNDGSSIGRKYTGDGADVSPPLAWSDLPAGTETLALICDDPDAPRGTWVHWVLFNLPATTALLSEGAVPAEAVQGKNDFGNIGYGGPAPPRGKPHRYFFKLYALDATLSLREGATKAQVETAMKDHILAQAQVVGTYARA